MDANARPRRIVVIGAVAAGTSAAAKARRNDEEAEIVLYERDRHISYSGCGMPYYIGGLLSDFKEIVPRDAAYFKKKYNVDVRIRHEVVSVDPEAYTLTVKNLETGETFGDRYDTLVLATGAMPVILPVPGVEGDHVFPLRNPTHALGIRGFLEQRHPKSAVVIGSGFIGLEMVENLAHAGLAVSLVEKLPHVCPFVDPDLSPYVLEALEQHGVTVRTRLSASAIRPGEVELEDGSTLPGDLVILAVGIRPETGLARAMGVALGANGAIQVDESMRTNLPDVYACGDCAENVSIVDRRRFYRPLGSTANKTGRICGDVITGGPLVHRGVAGTGIFRVFDRAVAATGLNEREARATGRDVVVSHNIKPDRPDYLGGREMVIKTIADRADGTLLGVQIVGFEGVDKRIDVLVTAMTAGLKAADLFHLDLAYAPPFATTKDPVHYTGMILENALSRGRELLGGDQLAAAGEGVYTVVDTRVPAQYEAGHVPGAINLPQEQVREALAGLDRNKPIVTYCNKGVTGNAVQNILLNNGFKRVYTLSGGFRQFQSCRVAAGKLNCKDAARRIVEDEAVRPALQKDGR